MLASITRVMPSKKFKRRQETMPLNNSEEIIEDIRLGKMVILMDDEDR